MTDKYSLNRIQDEKGERIVLIISDEYGGIGRVAANLTKDYNWLVDHYGKLKVAEDKDART